MARRRSRRRSPPSTTPASAPARAPTDTVTARADSQPTHDRVAMPGWDTLVIAGLVIAFIQILSLAESAGLPWRVQDVFRHPILGQILPQAGMEAMGEIGPRPGEPIGLLLNAIGLGLLGLYLIIDLAGIRARGKWLVLAALVVTLLVGPTAKLMLLREQSGPASYTHDGGVIQTEATIQYLLAGLNPYVEDYVETPMAEWGFSEYRTALYHYPYLPWTFVFSAPFYLLGQALGFYDQRMVYLLLLAIALALAPTLTTGQRSRRALVAILAFNPIMALDVVFGQNDVFVLAWLIFALAAWQRWDTARVSAPARARRFYWMAWVCFGLACASKPTAWFFAPYFGLLMMRGRLTPAMRLAEWPRVILRTVLAAWPALLTLGILVGPYLIWDWYALYEDVWRWSSGQGETGYQIWGWGASNFVLGLGLVEDRFGQWPFQLVQLLLSVPLLAWFLHRQQKANTLSNACWHYGLWLFVFFYAGRFLNENYLGYILAFLAIGILARGQDEKVT
jgi:hypothetical protein